MTDYSLTQELDEIFCSYEKIKEKINKAADGYNHGVSKEIMIDCLNLPRWCEYNGKPIYVVGLSDDKWDNYWIFFEKGVKLSDCTKELTYPHQIEYEYKLRFCSCLYDIFANKLSLTKDNIHLSLSSDEKELIKNTVLESFEKQNQVLTNINNTFNTFNEKDRLLYLAL